MQLYANELSEQDRYKPTDLLMTQESTATHKCHHVCYTNMHFQTKRGSHYFAMPWSVSIFQHVPTTAF